MKGLEKRLKLLSTNVTNEMTAVMNEYNDRCLSQSTFAATEKCRRAKTVISNEMRDILSNNYINKFDCELIDSFLDVQRSNLLGIHMLPNDKKYGIGEFFDELRSEVRGSHSKYLRKLMYEIAKFSMTAIAAITGVIQLFR